MRSPVDVRILFTQCYITIKHHGYMIRNVLISTGNVEKGYWKWMKMLFAFIQRPFQHPPCRFLWMNENSSTIHNYSNSHVMCILDEEFSFLVIPHHALNRNGKKTFLVSEFFMWKEKKIKDHHDFCVSIFLPPFHPPHRISILLSLRKQRLNSHNNEHKLYV